MVIYQSTNWTTKILQFLYYISFFIVFFL